MTTLAPVVMPLGNVLAACADANIADRIRAKVAVAGHHVLTFLVAPLGEFAAFVPDRDPFFERQQNGISRRLA